MTELPLSSERMYVRREAWRERMRLRSSWGPNELFDSRVSIEWLGGDRLGVSLFRNPCKKFVVWSVVLREQQRQGQMVLERQRRLLRRQCSERLVLRRVSRQVSLKLLRVELGVSVEEGA